MQGAVWHGSLFLHSGEHGVMEQLARESKSYFLELMLLNPTDCLPVTALKTVQLNA